MRKKERVIEDEEKMGKTERKEGEEEEEGNEEERERERVREKVRERKRGSERVCSDLKEAKYSFFPE